MPYKEWGEPIDGVPPVIALGGISTRPSDWAELPLHLDRHFIAIGIPDGCEHPDVPTIGRYASYIGKAALEIVRDRYDVQEDKPVEIDELAWSWGGFPAQKLAIRSLYGELKVRRMVLMATMPAGMTPFGWVPQPRNVKAAMAIMGHDRNGHDPRDVYGGDYWDNEEILKRFENIVGRKIDSHSHRRQVEAAFMEMMSGSLTLGTMMTRWMGIGPRTLVMLGDDDPVIPYGLARNLALGALMEPHTVHKGGHLFPAADPEGTAQTITEFLDEPVRLPFMNVLGRMAFA